MLTITSHQNYKLLNFHPQHRIDEIHNWLEDDSCSSLVLHGQHGSGRGYLLEAACFEYQFQNKPYVVVPIDWSEIKSEDAIEYLKARINSQFDDEREKTEWLQLLSDSFNLQISTPTIIGLSLGVNLRSALVLTNKLFPALKQALMLLKTEDSYSALRRVIQAFSSEYHLVLHIKHAELLTLIDPSWLEQELCQPLNRRAYSLQDQKDEPGRVLLAFSTPESSNVRDRLFPLTSLNEPWVIKVESITYGQIREVINTKFHPNHFDTLPTNPVSLFKRYFQQKHSLNALNQQFTNLLYEYAVPYDESERCHLVSIRNACAELLSSGLLVQDEGYWQLHPTASEDEINAVIGHPIRQWNRSLMQMIDEDNSAPIKAFLQLAALCDPYIPWEPLLHHVSDKYLTSKESLETCLLENWCTSRPLLKKRDLIESEHDRHSRWYFTNSLLAVTLRPPPQEISITATDLLAWLPQQLTLSDRRYGSLILQLAQLAGGKLFAEWHQQYSWWVEEQESPLLEQWVLEQLKGGQMKIAPLLQVIDQNFDIWSIPKKHAALNACRFFYDGEVPLNMEGGQFCMLDGKLKLAEGQYIEGLTLLQQALVIVKQVLPEGHLTIATYTGSVGYALGTLGRHVEALKHHLLALGIQQQTLPKRHPYIASSHCNIGHMLGALGETGHALTAFEKAFDIQQKVLPKDHLKLAKILNNIGVTYDKLNKYDLALASYQKALDIQLPEGHPIIATLYSNMGVTLSALGQYNESLKYQYKTLEIQKQTLPEGHPDIANYLNHIGTALCGLGQHENGLDYHQQSLVVRQKGLPEGHPAIATSLEHLSYALEGLGRHEEKLEVLNEALVIQQRALPKRSLITAKTLKDIALTHSLLGQHDEAIENFQKELVIIQESLPEGHSGIAACIRNIAVALDALGRHDEASEIQQQQHAPHLKKISNRNTPCSCESGKRYKHCCGQLL